MRKALDILLGKAIGDAVGVPYEFKSRRVMEKNPATDMVGNGSHNQPVGTWSDDTSLALCLAESIGEGLDLDKVAEKFVMWKYGDYMVAGKYIFDIGNATSKSIENLLSRKHNQVEPENCGLDGYGDNGNGSVMRILPLAYYFHKLPEQYPTYKERFELVKKVSGLTHGHFISCMASHILVEFALQMLEQPRSGRIKNWLKTQVLYGKFIFENKDEFPSQFLSAFDRVLDTDFYNLGKSQISGSGYAVHTLEAAVWCLMNTEDYKSCVLAAVNLGEDTDTTAAVAGGLAGIRYGVEGIPQEWKDKILKKELIEEIATKMEKI